MKVSQLISQLQGLNPNHDIVIDNGTENLQLTNISLATLTSAIPHPSNSNFYMKVTIPNYAGPMVSVVTIKLS